MIEPHEAQAVKEMELKEDNGVHEKRRISLRIQFIKLKSTLQRAAQR